MEYNTTRSKLTLREYGRNFHKLVDHLKTFKEKEKRNELSKTLIEMMKITHPDFRDQNEVDAKLCDDLYIMSNYDLNITNSTFNSNTMYSVDLQYSYRLRIENFNFF